MADATATAAPAPAKASRSGCALALGVSLIAIGSLFLLQNFYSYSLFGMLRASLRIFADYWPVLLVVWGGFKIYRYLAEPTRARVSAFEVFLLFIVIGTGLSLRAVRRVIHEIGVENPLDELFSVAGVDVLRGPAHRFTEEKTYDLAKDARLVFESPQSNVRISGWDEPRVSVVVTKLVHDPSEDEAARIAGEVELRFDDRDSVGSSVSREAEDSGSLGPQRARLSLVSSGNPQRVDVDVELRIPRATALTVRNRGRVEISDLSGGVEIATTDENVEVWNVTGGIKAKTRHGSMRVDNASGSVDLQNHDGEIRVTNLTGDLHAETSHGAIQAEGISGRVSLGNAHGSIHVSGVGGAVEIKGTHAEVSVETAKQNVSIASTHQPIFVRGVDGDLTIDAKSSVIQAIEIRGRVDVGNAGEPVTIARVRGAVTVKSRESRVTTDDVAGPLTIETSNEDVRVGEFGSSLTVRSTHSAIDAQTKALKGNVSLETSYGAVDLRLPQDAAIRLRASTKDGEVASRVPGLELVAETQTDGERFRGTLGAGTYEVTVDTSYGDVHIGVPES
jgi:Toastrack DUF4097